MSQFLKTVSLSLFSFALWACGGGGGDERPLDEVINPGPKVGSVELLTSSPQLPSAGSESVLLTAVVKGSDNVVLPGIEVSFAADNDATVQVTRATTDSSGAAEAVLTTTGNKNNRTINVRASAGDKSDTGTVAVMGTQVTAAGPTAAVLGNAVTLSLALRDSDQAGIPNTTLSVTSERGNPIDNPQPRTGADGQVTVTITPAISGQDIITVSAAGATALKHDLLVSPDSFTFAPAAVTPIGTPVEVSVVWSSAGIPVVGQPVSFAATRGAISGGDAGGATDLTDAQGRATVMIQSADIGPSIVTASAAGVTTQLDLRFVATEAASLELQVEPSVIGANALGSDNAERATVVATVRDPRLFPVEGTRVRFNLPSDPSGGALNPIEATTNEFGQATTVFIAGPAPTGLESVEIRGTLVDNPAISGTTDLTVAEQKLFITLGSGNSVAEPNPATYAVPYSVLVTDAAGLPLANVQVALNIWPRNYRKGFYVCVDRGGPSERWAPLYTLRPLANRGRDFCPNEDTDRNGIFTPSIDFNENNNCTLEPGNLVTVSAPVVTTDASGLAFFDVVFAQQFANWVEVELTARARVSGTEDIETAIFILSGAAGDFNDCNVSPPGVSRTIGTTGQGVVASPFGISSRCAEDEIPVRARDEGLVCEP